MRKIKVSFEITDNWNIEGFRSFIKVLLSDSDAYDVYLISNDDNSAYIGSVAQGLNLESNRIFVTNFTEDKIQTIIDQNIDVHFDNLQSVTLLVDETTDAYGILVTKNLNKFYLEPDYVITFNNVLKIIDDSTN